MLTACGTVAAPPVDLPEEPTGGAVVLPEDLAGHPQGCPTDEFDEDFVAGMIDAATLKVEDHLGYSVRPKLVTRCFDAASARVDIGLFLRVDEVAYSSGCGCSGTWTTLDDGDVMLGDDVEAPWSWLAGCGGTSLKGRGVRVTGVEGGMYPLRAAVKTVIIMLTAEALQSTRNANQVIVNNETGETRYQVPKLNYQQLRMLDRLTRQPLVGVPL